MVGREGMMDSDREKLDAASVVAFVHAKGESERLPGKNLRILGDRPLVCHAIRNALAAELVDAVVIDSDSDEILRVGAEAGALPLKRPAGLATNKTNGHDLAGWQADNVPIADIALQVVPTSPFVAPGAIDTAILLMGGFESVAAMRCDNFYQWKRGVPAYEVNGRIPNSGDLRGITYETCGLYVFRQSFAAVSRRRTNPERCQWVWLSKTEAVDINTEEDFEFAEIVWRGLQSVFGGDRK